MKNKSGISLGEIEDIQKRLESGSEISAQEEAKLEAASKAFSAVSATVYNAISTLGETIQSYFAPLTRDAQWAQQMIELLDSLGNESFNDAFQKIQDKIDEDNPVTGRQVVYLIMESRGIDVAAGLRLEKKTQLQNLADGRKMANEKKEKRAIKYHAEWRQWAIDTLQGNPFWDLDKVAEHVLFVATAQGHKMANGNTYKVITIRKEIKGVLKSMKLA